MKYAVYMLVKKNDIKSKINRKYCMPTLKLNF